MYDVVLVLLYIVNVQYIHIHIQLGQSNTCYMSSLHTIYYVSNPSNAEATFIQRTTDANTFGNHLNPVMLVLIGELLLNTLR